MSSGTQANLDWTGADPPSLDDGFGGLGGAAGGATKAIGTGAGLTYLTDEEILGIGAASQGGEGGSGDEIRTGGPRGGVEGDRADIAGTAENRQAEARPTGAPPAWLQALAADPKNAAEAQLLWREHQEFRSAFSSPEEARAIKELLPGGVKHVLSLRDATQSVERIDAAIFSGDARAQSEVVAELARANPAAFRSLFAEAARVLAGMGQGQGTGDRAQVAGTNAGDVSARDTFARARAENRRQDAGATTAPLNTNHQSPVTGHQSPDFDPAAYASFERATNDAVARDVRGAISDTLARVMPDGVADGAARRIGEDIFHEVHRALAADQNLSEQVASVLRDRRFGGVEQQRVASLLAGRAKQLVPSVARRVIGEWTSSVLNTARSKASRQAAAASRVDIAAPGGSLDSMPLRQMSPREVDYASMSDEQILGM